MVKSDNFVIPLVIYPFDVMVSLGETDEQLKKAWVGKYNLEWRDDMILSGNGKCIITDGNQTLIRARYYPTDNQDCGTLQHEIFHAVSMVLDAMGMKLEIMVSDEAYAYLIGYLTKQIYDRIWQ
jgi:hypothetical protein